MTHAIGIPAYLLIDLLRIRDAVQRRLAQLADPATGVRLRRLELAEAES